MAKIRIPYLWNATDVPFNNETYTLSDSLTEMEMSFDDCGMRIPYTWDNADFTWSYNP